MAQGRADIVRDAFAAYDRGDLDAVLSHCDEGIEIFQAPELPGVAPRQHGHAGVLEAFGIWPEQWDDFRIEILRLEEVGDHVVVTTRQSGRGKDSGVPVQTDFTFLFLVRAEKIAEWRIFVREEDAREALGRSEEVS